MLLELKRHDEAIAAVDRVLGAGLRVPPAFVIRGHALWRSGKIPDAARSFTTAVELNPRDAETRENLGRLLLQLGDFKRGWREYEYRLARLTPFPNRSPRWNGEDIAGKSLLVVAEQGLGDTLQFVRYVPLLTGRGAKVAAIVQPPLLDLLRTVDPSVEWTSERNNAGTFNYQIDLMSIPGLLKTRLETIPNTVPYVSARPELIAHWRAAIGPDGIKVGIAWQGSTGARRDDERTIPLEHLAALGAVPGVRLISIQAINGLEQLTSLPAGMTVEPLGDRIANNPRGIDEIAAVMANLDLVVTSDTMTAHLAGALARPVWVGLKHDADWRWLTERSDSPWYPTMRLFRQAAPGDWAGMGRAMAAALAEWPQRS